MVEGQILSTCSTGRKVCVLSDHFRKSKQRRRAAWRRRIVTRGREKIKHVAIYAGEEGVRRIKGRMCDEEVRKHLSVPTRFCGSWSSPREPMEANQFYGRPAIDTMPIGIDPIERREGKERERSMRSFYPRRGMRRDAKLPAVAIRTFRRFRSRRTRSGLEVLASSNLQKSASDRLVYRRRNKAATRVISIKLLFPHSRMTTTCRAYSSWELAQFRRYCICIWQSWFC